MILTFLLYVIFVAFVISGIAGLIIAGVVLGWMLLIRAILKHL